MRRAAALLKSKAIVCYTSSGHTSLRAARERADSPILSLSPCINASRKLALAWGVHSVHVEDPKDLRQLAPMAIEVATMQGFVQPGDPIVILAGVPFGETGTTNMIRIAIA
jgi:pyruvate kinase